MSRAVMRPMHLDAVLVAHRLGVARMADRILVVDGGRIVEQGTHAELVAADGLYARMWRAQASLYLPGRDGAGTCAP